MRCVGILALSCLVASAALAAPAAPGWFLQGTHPDTGGRSPVGPGGKVLPPSRDGGAVLAGCSDDIEKLCQGRSGLYAARACLTENRARLSGVCKADLATLPPSSVPACSHSPLCDNRLGPTREDLQRVQWKQTPGYRITYPFDLPKGGGGASGVGIDSKGRIWVLQRTAPGKPQLFQFGPDYRLIRPCRTPSSGGWKKATASRWIRRTMSGSPTPMAAWC